MQSLMDESSDKADDKLGELQTPSTAIGDIGDLK